MGLAQPTQSAQRKLKYSYSKSYLQQYFCSSETMGCKAVFPKLRHKCLVSDASRHGAKDAMYIAIGSSDTSTERFRTHLGLMVRSRFKGVSFL